MPDPRFDEQYARIQEAYDANGIPTYLEVDEETGQPVAIYPDDRLVIREEWFARAQDLMGGVLRDAEVETIPGLRVVLIDGPTAREARARIEGAFGPDVVDFNYLFSITPAGKCPAAEPEVPHPFEDFAPPSPPVAAAGGAGVRIAVSDTGLLADAGSHSWLRGVTGNIDPLGPIDPATGLPVIPLYAGHGTLIAGVVRCTAPDAQVRVSNEFPAALGAAIDSMNLSVGLTKVLATGVDVISLSAGTTLPGNQPDLTLNQFVANNLAELARVVIVAAAGNNSSNQPFFPAAIREPWMLSVGALGGDNQHLAWFSDFNPPVGQPWIDVFAPGENLVNAFASGLYVYDWAPRKGSRQVFTGMARWSGTSFATPLVAGLVATRMAAATETPQQARTALLALAQAQSIPGVGPALYARR